MPTGLVEQENGMLARSDLPGNLCQMQAHHLGVAGGLGQGSALAVPRTDRPENIGGGGALVVRCRRACSAPCPTARDLGLLADAHLVGEPDFYVGRIDAHVLRDVRHTEGEALLKSSIAPSACA